MRVRSLCQTAIAIPLLLASCRETPRSLAEVPPRWRMEDFGGVLSVGLEGYRDFKKGEIFFVQQGCAGCHAFAKHSAAPQRAKALDGPALQYTPEELLEHLLSGDWHQRKSVPVLNDLEQADVLDLMAYILSGARADHAFFQTAQ